MSTPCDKCLCLECSHNALVPQPYYSNDTIDCFMCSNCKALRGRTAYAGDALAVETCTAFTSRNELGGADNDGAHVQQNAATRDA